MCGSDVSFADDDEIAVYPWLVSTTSLLLMSLFEVISPHFDKRIHLIKDLLPVTLQVLIPMWELPNT